MSITQMKYKDYTWKHNPKTIKITRKSNLKDLNVPYAGSIIQNLGLEKRIISGSGELFGQDCYEQFNILNDVYREQESGYLHINGISPFKAFFRYLNLESNPQPNLISYSFEFWEDMQIDNSGLKSFAKYHVVTQGETLWDISYIYGTSVYKLIKLNPNIKNPEKLYVGQRVIVA